MRRLPCRHVDADPRAGDASKPFVEDIMLRLAPLWVLAGWVALVAVNVGLAIAVSFSGAL
jgi:hypothetical protein